MVNIAFIAAKGGVGKTTSAMLTASALVATGEVVTLIDTDPQASAYEAANRIEENSVPLPYPVKTAGVDFAKRSVKNADWVILDTPPGDQRIIDTALRWADIALLPTRPGVFDLVQTVPLLNLAKQVGTPAAVLLTQVRPQVKETLETKEALEEHGALVLGTDIPLLARTSRLTEIHPSIRDLEASGYSAVAQELKEAFGEPQA